MRGPLHQGRTRRVRVFVGAWAASAGTLIPIGMHLGGDSPRSQAPDMGVAAVVAVAVALVAAFSTRLLDGAGLVWMTIGPIGFTVSYIPHAIDAHWLVWFGVVAAILGPGLGVASLVADRLGRDAVVTSLLVAGLTASGLIFAVFWYFGVGLYAPFYALTVASALPRPAAHRSEPSQPVRHPSPAL